MIYQLTLYMFRAFTFITMNSDAYCRDDLSIDIIHVTGTHIYVCITRNSDD